MQPVLRLLKTVRIPAWALSVTLLGSCGCANLMDTITSREFKFKDLYTKPPDPLTVLSESDDGERRGKALAKLKEPLRNGGTQEQQELYIKLLVTAATKNPPPRSGNPNDLGLKVDPDCLDPLVRLGAISALAGYQDPRAAKALVEVYLNSGTDPSTLPQGARQGTLPFLPEVNSKIKMQALEALEKTGSPTAHDLFIEIARSPGPGTKGAQEDISQTIDERLAALRGLARFRDYEVLNTLVGVLEAEKNIAMRDRAHLSLKEITGKNLPLEAVAWRNLIQTSPRDAFAREPNSFQKFFNFMAH